MTTSPSPAARTQIDLLVVLHVNGGVEFTDRVVIGHLTASQDRVVTLRDALKRLLGFIDLIGGDVSPDISCRCMGVDVAPDTALISLVPAALLSAVRDGYIQDVPVTIHVYRRRGGRGEWQFSSPIAPKHITPIDPKLVRATSPQRPLAVQNIDSLLAAHRGELVVRHEKEEGRYFSPPRTTHQTGGPHSPHDAATSRRSLFPAGPHSPQTAATPTTASEHASHNASDTTGRAPCVLTRVSYSA